MGLAQGANLGTAQGSITINTQGVTAAVPVVAAASAQMTNSFGGLANAAKQVASAFGLSFGAAGAVQLGRMAVAAVETATAYNRQAVAAVNLAGSQSKLNDMLAAYASATGGAIDDATALANVTKLMSVGFADNVPELEKFATAIRGISVAMGTSQDMVTQNLILELFSQRGQRLDQLGLEYEKVKQRAKELEAADGSLTSKQAYQNAVLEQATERYGKLAKSAEGAATGIELASKAADNAMLAIGQAISWPVNAGALVVASWIQQQTDLLHGEERAAQDLYAALQRLAGVQVATGMQQRFIASSAGREIGRHGGSSIANAPNPNAEEIQQVHLDWAKGIQAINEQVHTDIIDEETSFGQQRAKTVADYSKSIARDEQAYARTRLRENLDFLESMAAVAKDATRREAGAAADLARTLGQAETDSADKIAGFRKDTNKRLVELDEDYEKARAKRAEDLNNKLLDAAGNLDAKQVYELQRNAATQEEEAKEAHDDQRKKVQEQLDERIDDERKSLEKSTRQQQEAYQRQIDEGRANDALKLQDMKDAFTKQQTREAEDHQTQVDQRAQDQADELTAQDTAHNLRLEQIANHAQADRDALDEQAKTDLLALGVRNAAWQKVQDDKETALEKMWDKFMAHVNGTLLEGRPNTPQMTQFASGGYVPHDMMAMVHAGEYVTPAAQASMGSYGPSSSSRSITVGDIHLHGAATDSPEDYARRFERELLRVLEGATR